MTSSKLQKLKYLDLCREEAGRMDGDGEFNYAQMITGVSTHRIAHARYRVWRLLRREGYSLPEIGRVSGYHHTSIMAGVRKLVAADHEERNARIVVGENSAT